MIDGTAAVRHACGAGVVIALAITLHSCAGNDAVGTGSASVLLITLDATRADHLGAYGNPLGLTPTLDELAARGSVFDAAYAPMPQTLPSHATLLTGLEPRLSGALENTYELPEHVRTLAEIFRDADYHTAAFVAALVLSRESGIDQGFETFDQPAGDPAERGQARRRGDRVTDAALAWAQGVGPRERFFLWAHYYDPHPPFMSPPETHKRIRRSSVREWLESRPRALRQSLDRAELLRQWREYGAEIRFMDEQIARLLAGLEALELMGETVVVVVGDHGEGLAEHGSWGHGINLHEEVMRVPLLITDPRQRLLARIAQPVSIGDVFPTILSLAFATPPERPAVPSADLAPLVTDGAALAERPLFLERPHFSEDRLRDRTAGHGAGWGFLTAVVDTRYKLMRMPNGTAFLYDLENDPGERSDLAAREPERVRHMQTLLDEWADRRPCPLPGEASSASPERLDALRALGYLGGDEE